MTNYRAILEYHYKGNTTTQVAKLCECSRTTVLKTIKRAKQCGLELPLSNKTSDYDLLKTFIRNACAKRNTQRRIFMSWKRIKRRENSRFSLCGAGIIKELWRRGKNLTANRSFSRCLRCIGPIPNFTFNRRKR